MAAALPMMYHKLRFDEFGVFGHRSDALEAKWVVRATQTMSAACGARVQAIVMSCAWELIEVKCV